MDFFVDSADLDAVRAINAYFPIDGFTTNPNILTKATRPLEELFQEYRDYVHETGLRVFVQVTAQTADEMFAQASRLRAFFGGRLVVKLPATEDGYRACKLCRAKGIPFGFGGIASMGNGAVSSEYIIREHYRLDSNGAILSRSFCNLQRITDLAQVQSIFGNGMADIRNLEQECRLRKERGDDFSDNQRIVAEKIRAICERK